MVPKKGDTVYYIKQTPIDLFIYEAKVLYYDETPRTPQCLVRVTKIYGEGGIQDWSDMDTTEEISSLLVYVTFYDACKAVIRQADAGIARAVKEIAERQRVIDHLQGIRDLFNGKTKLFGKQDLSKVTITVVKLI
jgi:hypothetical protein